MKTKDEYMEAMQNWEKKVQNEDIRCSRCGHRIPYGEQDSYYERGLCAACASVFDKDD